MTIARHFDSLADYQAGAVRVVPVEGEPEDLLGQGGGLQAAFDRLGQRPLVGVLRDPAVASVTLADGELLVSLQRVGAGGRLRVMWADDNVVVDEHVEVPPATATGPGPWFRPDPDTEVGPEVLDDPTVPLHVVADLGGQLRWFTGGLHGPGVGQCELRSTIPAIDPSQLGSAAFREAHGVKWAYVVGAMAGGISSADLVISMANAGMLSFFGSGGLPLEAVEAALERVSAEAKPGLWGFNLLHNPVEPAVEEGTVDLYLEHDVRRISASAYMGLSPAVVRYRLHGLRAGPDGQPVVDNRVFAKVSRPEVAEKFLRPAPEDMLRELVQRGALTEQQALLAVHVPIATDITAEADSGGHTDHRPLLVLLPALRALRDRVADELGYRERPRVGAAGGLGTPAALYAAFSMGADYVLTGSVNQATVEAGTSPLAKQMLGDANFWDVATGPAPDMFEIGAKVQVLSRGSMYAQRAQRLHDLYKRHESMEDIGDADRKRIVKQMFRRPLEEVWQGTREYWSARDPKQVERAESDPRHKMALTFRWYLGMTSRWARTGDDDRKRDFQVWCGPAMGAFNDWARDTAMADVQARTVVGVAEALMHGAAQQARRGLARTLIAPGR